MTLQSQIIRERYKIVEEIARGGMGVVYLAKDLLTNSSIALKTSSWANEVQTRDAFETEAKLLARLDHPGLPKVRDYFLLDNNFQALVMDYVEGATLSEILNSGEYRTGQVLHPNIVIEWMAQILDILIYLHGFTPPVIHRDIKPNNLKLKPDGTIVLLDFGLAKGSAMSVVSGGSGYSSLEQLNLVTTDPRSDIYALGATVFHLLTKTVPLNAMSRFQAICGGSLNFPDKNSQTDPQKSVSELNSQVPAEISGIVMKAMSVFPEDRFQTAENMKEALDSARNGLTNLSVNLSGGKSNAVNSQSRAKTVLDENEEKLGVWTSGLSQTGNQTPDSSASGTNAIDKTRLSFHLNDNEKPSAGHHRNPPDDDFTTFEVSRLPDSKPAAVRRGKKLVPVILGVSAIVLLFMAGVAAWVFFQPKNKSENSATSTNSATSSNNQSSVLLSAKPVNKPMAIETYLINADGQETKLTEDHLFENGEQFRFGVKSDTGGYLYVLSRNNQDKAQLAYPRPDQVDNSIEKKSERAFPPDNGKFGFNKDSPSEMWAYFVVVASRENDLAKRIRVVLGNNKEKSLSLPDVDKLFKDLDQIAEDSAKKREAETDSKETADVVITKLQKK